MYLERYGQPPVIGEIETGASEADINTFMSHLEALQQRSVLVHRKGQRDLRYLETTPGSSAVRSYGDRLDYNNRQISRAILVPDLVFSEGLRVGSKALGTVHGQTFLWVVTQLGTQIAEVFTEQAVRELVLWNFEGAAVPNFRIRAFTNAEAVLEMLEKMIESDIVAPDEEWIRDRLNIPTAALESSSDDDESSK